MCPEHDANNEEMIFRAALRIESPDERVAYVREACGEDVELFARVQALLGAHEEADDFLESPPVAPDVTLEMPPSAEGPGTKIGRYELLELIGEGGMGLVYLAEQKRPVKRRVALKIIKPGMDSKQVIARFEAERQALAVLDHPNIAHVFDAGATGTGRPYFVMEYVKGQSITKYCDERKLNVEERLKLFKEVCEGVHHAHQKGIIHRDIKPSNILVSLHGDRAVPKIIDFGIAKAITQPLTGKTFVTYQGQLLGTPEYMSPEQVDLATQDIDIRSDIYSLGVLLYELLAGVLPFERDSFAKAGLAEIQRTIREQEPSTPSTRLTGLGDEARAIAESRRTQVLTLARCLKRELEWIPMKAMRKDRTRRYRSASELADDVRNYLSGLPLIAGPETASYRVKKFVRKHAGSVATVALVAVAIVLGLVVSMAMYVRAERALQREASAREQAEQAEQATRRKAEELRGTLYVNSIQLADAKHREGDARRVRSLLASCPNDLRGWEWNRLNYVSDHAIMTLRGASGPVNYPTFSPDGKLIASDGWGKTVKTWDAATGLEAMNFAGHEDDVCCVTFSPDGQRLASGSADKTVKVWDLRSGRELRTLHGHDNEVYYVAFSPDGKRIASTESGGATKIWDAATGRVITNIQRRVSSAGGLEFSPDGRYIASGDFDGIRVWDTNGAGEIMTIPSAHKLWVTCVTYSSDGRYIMSCGWDSRIRVWDASTGKETMALRSRSQRLNCVGYDSSDKLIVAQGQGSTIDVWDTVTGEILMTLAGHDAPVQSASFSHEGRRIVSGSADGTVRVWGTSCSKERTVIRTETFVQSLSYSPDGENFATDGPRGGVTIWDAAAGIELMTLPDGGRRNPFVAFAPDGRQLASRSSDGIVKLWDCTTGAQLVSFSEHNGYGKVIRAMAFSPDGRNIVLGGDDGLIRVFDTKMGVELMRLPGHEGPTLSLAFSPDGTRIISAGRFATVKVWGAATGTELLSFKADQERLSGHIAISHDGRRVAAGTEEGSIIIWDAESGKQLKTWSAHTGVAQGVSFSPDDRRLASVSRTDSTVKVWDTATGTELMTLVPLRDVYAAVFSPDGHSIAALCVDGIILWETTEPTGGYVIREAGQTARTLVNTLCQKHGLYHDAVDELQADETLDESVRRMALQIATAHKWKDVPKLNDEAWETVCACDRSIEAYREALAKAQRASGWEPNDPVILRTLGAALYRTADYEDSFGTLTTAEELRANNGDEPDPADLAFTAMSLHKVGRPDKAKAALEQLQRLTEDDRFAGDSEVQALLVLQRYEGHSLVSSGSRCSTAVPAVLGSSGRSGGPCRRCRAPVD